MADRAGVDVTCSCKVGRLIEDYELDDANEDLVARWTDDDDRDSLRKLTERFNQTILRRAMDDAGMHSLDGEIANLYRLLTDDEVSAGMRTQSRKRLERNGIDIEELDEHFVSYQTIYRHLNDCLDTSFSVEEADPDAQIEKSAQRAYALQNRTVAVTTDALSHLRSTGALALDEFDIFVDIRVTCEACDAHYSLSELLKRGGCRCQLEA